MRFGSCISVVCYFFFFKQKTAYEVRISDWSADVCSSDLPRRPRGRYRQCAEAQARVSRDEARARRRDRRLDRRARDRGGQGAGARLAAHRSALELRTARCDAVERGRSEEHTSELQSPMRITYAVFCLKKKTQVIICAQKQT